MYTKLLIYFTCETLFLVILVNGFISYVDKFNTSIHKFKNSIHVLMCSSHMFKTSILQLISSRIHYIIWYVHHIRSKVQHSAQEFITSSYHYKISSHIFKNSAHMFKSSTHELTTHLMISRIHLLSYHKIEFIYNGTYKNFQLINIFIWYYHHSSLYFTCHKKISKNKNEMHKNLYSTNKNFH